MDWDSITSPPQVGAEILVNQNFDGMGFASVYANNPATTAGLVYGLRAGRWGGFSYAGGTFTLSASTTTYLVVARVDGTPSISTATTNWNNTVDYARAYKLTTGASAVTAIEDHRAGPGGLHGGAGGDGSGGALVTAINVWTKNQSVATVALTDGSSIATDASLSNNFKVTLGGNRTLANPTNATEGMWLHWAITQDGTGSRTLAYGTAFKWPAGTPPVLSTVAGSKDTIAAYYDGAAWLASCMKGFA